MTLTELQAFVATEDKAGGYAVEYGEYVFSGDKRYKRFVEIMGREDPYYGDVSRALQDTQSVQYAMFNLENTFSLSARVVDGDLRLFGYIDDPMQIYIPAYWTFGRLSEYLSKDTVPNRSVSLSFTNAIIHLTIKPVQTAVLSEPPRDVPLSDVLGAEIDLDLLPSQNYCVKDATFVVAGRAIAERHFSEYTQTPSGYWFPCKSVFITRVPTKDGLVLESEETYTSHPNEVDFNVGIDPALFEGTFPAGTSVADMRHKH